MPDEQMANSGGHPATAAGPPPMPSAPPSPAARPLDTIDRSILRMLQTDGRASIRSVAERVHVSRANAYARINRLIDDGDPRLQRPRRPGTGRSGRLRLHHAEDRAELLADRAQAAHGAAGATHIALVSGDFDVLLLVHTKDNRELRELVLTRIQSIPEVLSTRTLLVFEETDLGPEEE